MAAPASRQKVIYAALIGNLMIAITKFVAAALTGSSAMASEGIHSFVDTGNEVLLLYGLRQSQRPPDRVHPLGYGRELYFWSFVVALLVFAVGAGVSIYEGVNHLLHPHPIENVAMAYAVLAISFVFEGISWTLALREFGAGKGRLGYVEAAVRSKDPSVFSVLFEDSAALLGLMLAAIGIAASQALQMPELDGVASIGIGIILAGTAAFLARESKALLIGEPAHAHVQASLLRIAAQDPAVRHANGVITSHLSPQQVFAALSAEFHDGLDTDQIEDCVDRIERCIREAHPEVTTLFVKPQSTRQWQARQATLADKAAEDVRQA